MKILRHLLAIAVLPFAVVVLVPLWIAGAGHVALRPASREVGLLAQAAGVIVLLAGLVLFVASLRRFATEGDGTLAPWDPPRRLVVRGPYRYVRNPMISGVVFVLAGEALVLLSPPHAEWALLFLVVNAVYIPLAEEPRLRTRFGAAYVEYCRNVPRLVPRLKAWDGSGSRHRTR